MSVNNNIYGSSTRKRKYEETLDKNIKGYSDNVSDYLGQHKVEVIKDTASTITFWGSVGATLGTALGYFFGPFGWSVSTASAVGGGLGVAYGAYEAYSCTYEKYDQWKNALKRNHTSKKLLPVVLALFKYDAVLCKLQCGLTHEFMKDPVVTPGGNYFERKAITKHLEKQKRGKDPLSGEALKVSQLKPAPEIKAQVFHRLREILNHETEKLKLSKKVIKGLDALSVDLADDRDHNFHLAKNNLKQKLDAQKITESAYLKKTNALVKVFYNHLDLESNSAPAD